MNSQLPVVTALRVVVGSTVVGAELALRLETAPDSLLSGRASRLEPGTCEKVCTNSARPSRVDSGLGLRAEIGAPTSATGGASIALTETARYAATNEVSSS